MGRQAIAIIMAFGITFANASWAQTTPQLFDQMAGRWDVRQRMWPAPDAKPIDLPAAVAERRLVEGKFIEETMIPAEAASAQGEGFQRTAFLNFNSVTGRYEYASLDSRAPQLMTETSERVGAGAIPGALGLKGGQFLAPQWGASKNVPFTYRLSIGPVLNREQTVRLYLTPRAVLPKKEFLAFEYVYVRRP